MAIFTKSLDQLINEASTKREKVENQIDNLAAEKHEIDASIEALTSQLIEFELDEDAAGQEKTRKEIKKLRDRLPEITSRIEAYQRIINKGVLNEKESDKIRAAIQKEKEDRNKQINPLLTEKEKAEQQIKALERRIKEIDGQVFNIRNENDRVLSKIKRILDCIDPRAKKIDYHVEQKEFIKQWITGGNTEHFFEPKPEWKGFTVTDRYVEVEERPNPVEVIPVNSTGIDGHQKTEYMTRKEIEERRNSERG